MSSRPPHDGSARGAGVNPQKLTMSDELTMKHLSASDFDAKEFVANITGELLSQQGDSYTFDPKPFLDHFEQRIEELHQLQCMAESNVAECRGLTEKAETKHKENIDNLQGSLSTIFNRFKRLDRMVQGVSHHSVRLGHTLERVDNQRVTSIEGREIMEHFLSFRDGMYNIDPIFSRDSPTDLKEAASIIQRLLSICEELRLKSDDPTYKLIAMYAGDIENKLLSLFEQAMTQDNIDDMKNLAQTLCSFPKQNVISLVHFKIIEMLNSHDELQHTHFSVREFKSKYGVFCSRIFNVCRKEFEWIEKVFPLPTRVSKSLVDRILDDKVQQYIDFSLDDPSKRSDENLSMLEIAYVYTMDLVVRLHKIIPKVANNDVEIGFTEKVEDLFSQKRRGYIETELAVFKKVAMNEIDRALEHGNSMAKQQEADEHKSIFERLKGDTDESKKAWLNDMLCPHTYEVKDTETGGSRKEKWDLCDRLIRRCTTSLRRCEKLAEPSLMADNMVEIFSVFLDMIVEKVMNPILLTIEDLLPEEDPKVVPDPFVFRAIRHINRIGQRIEAHYQMYFLVERLSNAMHSMNVLTFCQQQKQTALGRLSSSVGIILQHYLDSCINYVAKLLKRKKNSPYGTTDESVLGGAEDNSEAFNAFIEFVNTQYDAIIEGLEGKNLDIYLSAFGIRLYRTVMDHLKKCKVSVTGAFLLTRDLKGVVDCLKQFHLSTVTDLCEQLQAALCLFVVNIDSMKSIISEDKKVSQFSAEELHDLLKMRADYQANKSLIIQQLPK